MKNNAGNLYIFPKDRNGTSLHIEGMGFYSQVEIIILDLSNIIL